LHRRLIALQGMPLDELWHLRRLAEACAERGSHEFLLVSGILPLPRGVGSPANAHAVLQEGGAVPLGPLRQVARAAAPTASSRSTG